VQWRRGLRCGPGEPGRMRGRPDHEPGRLRHLDRLGLFRLLNRHGSLGGCGAQHCLDHRHGLGRAIQQIEGHFPLIAGHDDADHAALIFERIEFVVREGEAVANQQGMQRRDAIQVIAREAAIFGAAAGLAVSVVDRDEADAGEEFVQMCGQHQAEEVVHVTDVAADGGLRQAGAFGEGAQGDARWGEFGEDARCGFDDVGVGSLFPRGRLWRRWAGEYERAKDAGGGWFHTGTVARKTRTKQELSHVWVVFCCLHSASASIAVRV
jgi:hypothetical protein